MVLSPVLQLVPGHECHHSGVLVPTSASVDLHPNLELSGMRTDINTHYFTLNIAIQRNR